MPGAEVELTPDLTSAAGLGDVFRGSSTGLNFPVLAGTRLLVVVRAEVTQGPDVSAIVQGYFSGGIGLE